ncbi:MAG: tetratricopeptide repeat protein [Candidatus Omnitrophica bacterium]|nr:tetratricopeptide repeat protein [Candidatus Omnitrophota bacterium]
MVTKKSAATIASILLACLFLYASLAYSPFLTAEGFILTKFTRYKTPAIKILSKALEKDPNNARAFFLRGTAYSVTGQYQNALRDLKRYLDLAPNNARVHKMIGEILGITGDHVNAIDELSFSIAKDARNPSTFISRAYSYSRLLNFDAALEDYRKALELGSIDKEIYLGRGGIFLSRGEYGLAESEFSDGLGKNPYSFELFGQRAMARAELEKYDSAKADLKKALILNPTRKADFLYSIGNILEREGDTVSAVEVYTGAVTENPLMAESYYARGTVLNGLELYDKALSDLDKALELSPNDPMYHMGRAVTYLHMNETDKAIKDLERAVEIDPNFIFSHVVYMKLAYIYTEAGLMEKALDYCGKAISFYPDYVPAYRYRAEISLSMGRTSEALSDYDILISKDPATSEAHAFRAWAYFLKGDLKNSIADSDKAIELDPAKATPYYTRGLARYLAGDYVNSMADYTKAAELDHDTLSAYGVFLSNVQAPDPNDRGDVRGKIIELLQRGITPVNK